MPNMFAYIGLICDAHNVHVNMHIQLFSRMYYIFAIVQRLRPYFGGIVPFVIKL